MFLHASITPLRELGIGQELETALLKLRRSLAQRNQLKAEWVQEGVSLDHEGWYRNKAGSRYVPTLQAALKE